MVKHIAKKRKAKRRTKAVVKHEPSLRVLASNAFWARDRYTPKPVFDIAGDHNRPFEPDTPRKVNKLFAWAWRVFERKQKQHQKHQRRLARAN